MQNIMQFLKEFDNVLNFLTERLNSNMSVKTNPQIPQLSIQIYDFEIVSLVDCMTLRKFHILTLATLTMNIELSK